MLMVSMTDQIVIDFLLHFPKGFEMKFHAMLSAVRAYNGKGFISWEVLQRKFHFIYRHVMLLLLLLLLVRINFVHVTQGAQPSLNKKKWEIGAGWFFFFASSTLLWMWRSSCEWGWVELFLSYMFVRCAPISMPRATLSDACVHQIYLIFLNRLINRCQFILFFVVVFFFIFS